MTDGQPLIDRPVNPAVEALRRMADHVERNAQAGFGGCVVIVPPANGGDPIEILILDNRADVVQFYANLAARITVRTTELDAIGRQGQAFGRPR